METKDIILELRTNSGMSQDDLAEKVMVTRQAVSRWETGELFDTETLKLLSRVFDVSINTLLGMPRQLVCQCCGFAGVLRSAKSQMAILMKSTVNGAMRTGSSSTPARSS